MPRKTGTRRHADEAQGPASMRPRPDAAENAVKREVRRSETYRFNEAAARCRGKRTYNNKALRHHRGFNEAAARCRGKRVPCRVLPWSDRAWLQ